MLGSASSATPIKAREITAFHIMADIMAAAERVSPMILNDATFQIYHCSWRRHAIMTYYGRHFSETYPQRHHYRRRIYTVSVSIPAVA